MSNGEDQSGLRSASFFMLRTPSLPLSDADVVRSAFASPEGLRSHEIVDRPQVKEAIYLASQNLYEAFYERDAEIDHRTELALARYLLRMTSRSTPFGTFAGVGVGETGDGTDLNIGAADHGERVCRVDLGVLSSAQTGLPAAAASSLSSMPLVVNDSAWLASDGLRYVEAVKGAHVTEYRLSRVRSNAGIQLILETLRETPKTFEALVSLLVEGLDADEQEAKSFLAALLKEQVVVPQCQMAVTGSDVVRAFISELELAGDPPAEVKAIARASDELSSVGLDPLANVECYRRAHESLQPASGIEEGAKAIQVDLHWEAARPTFDAGLQETLTNQVEALAPLLTHAAWSMSGFTEEFEARYGDDWVPLLEVLDQDHGIVFGGSTRVPAPLLSRMNLGAPRGAASRGESREVDLMLQNWLVRALVRRESEVDLTDEDLKIMPPRQPFPSTMAVMGSLSEESGKSSDDPELMFNIGSIIGPPAAALMGRFSAASPLLATKLRGFIEETEGDTDDVIIAELAHLPDGRVGNVMLRPTLRKYEIEYRGRSGADRDFVIPASDLYVAVQHGRIFLYSKSLGKRVIPRVSNAHNLGHSTNLPIYRFLGALQRQDEGGAGFTWGTQLESSPYLPGVRYKNVRVFRERWVMSKLLARAFVSPEEASEKNLRKLSGYPTPPRRFRLMQADNFLELDLDNKLDREVFEEECRRSTLLTMEAIPGREDLATDAEGRRYNHQIVIPMSNGRAADRFPTPPAIHPQATRHIPGSDYLYARVFCGPAVSDRIVAEEFEEFRQFTHSEGGERVFFIRYMENGYHLRIRAAGAPEILWGPIRAKLETLLRPHLDSRAVNRIEYATYFPEHSRYGNVETCEAIFAADSAATSAALRQMIPLGDLEERRWRFAAVSLLDLIQSGLDTEQEVLAQLQMIADGYAREFSLGKQQNNELKAAFRRHRDVFDAVAQSRPDPELDAFRDIVAARRRMSADAMAVMRNADGLNLRAVMPSLFHMTANRIFAEQGRAHELMLSHLLIKALKGAAARKRYATEPAARQKAGQAVREKAIAT